MTRGAWALLASVPAITVMTLGQRQALDDGASPATILVGQFTVSALVLLLATPALGGRPSRGRSRLSVGVGVALAASVCFGIAGLDRLPVGILVVLIFAAPVWVALYELLIRHRKLQRRTFVAIAGVLGGLMIMVNPLSVSLNGLGITLGLLTSGVTAAFVVLLDRAQATDGFAASSHSALLASAIAGIVVGLCASTGDVTVSSSPLAIAISGIALPLWFLLFSVGLRASSPLFAVMISSAEPVVAAAAAYLYFDETLALHELAGAAVIIAGVVLGAIAEKPVGPEAPLARATGRL